jgi:membrane fusion protein, heavy metal efflux system
MVKKYNYIIASIIMISNILIFTTNTAMALEQNHDSEESTIGPHRGRLLESSDFAIELTISESDGPPVFKAYAYSKNELIQPNKVKLRIELSRLDGDKNIFNFQPEQEYLIGQGIVEEPHSFDVKISAQYNGKNHAWAYSSYEGRTLLTEEAAKKSNVKTEIAKSGVINQYAVLTGRVALNRNTTSQVRARFPGIVKKVHVNWGDQVQMGQALASIESNESLKNYNITSPINGIVLSRNTNTGDVVGSESMFTIADLSEVWGEFHVFPGDLNKVRPGQEIKLHTMQNKVKSKAHISMLLPTADPLSQTVVAIAPLSNQDGKWRPGMIIEGEVHISKKEVPLAVRTSALQRFRDFNVVFEKIGNTYEVRMLELGDNDGEWVEVKSGLKPGTEYVTDNSFIIKADIEKSGASHDH